MDFKDIETAGVKADLGDDPPFYLDLLPQAMPDRVNVEAMQPWRDFLTELRFTAHKLYPTLHDDVRTWQFMSLVAKVQSLPFGDFIECGTLHGHTARIIWRMMRLVAPEAKLLCFDTFAGFDAADLDAENELWRGHKFTKWSFESWEPKWVRRYITDGDGPEWTLELVPGHVPESLKPHKELRFRLAHLDMDLWLPTKDALEWIWPRMVPGGVVICHDYDVFEGIRRAVDDFLGPLGIAHVPMGDRYGSVIAVKPPMPRRG